MNWNKTKIQLENGQDVDAQAPVIISASRSTDIPAFYADWFFNRLEKGYSAWTNPFNGVKSYVSYKHTQLIVFWSKNPKPLLEYLPILKGKNIDTYIQYTLNDYVKEELEKGVPSLQQRIDTFKRLVDAVGFGKVIWRFDPFILTDKISKDDLLAKVDNIGNQLKGYTEKMVFSYADILSYRKVKNNLEKNHINYNEFSKDDMNYLAQGLVRLNDNWQYVLATCGEKIDLEKYGIQHNKCIDDDLMIKYFFHNKKLMDFLKVEIKVKQNNLFGNDEILQNAIILDDSHYAIKNNTKKDGGQRPFCGCMASKDIGEYNTCPHLCEYCYANTSKEIAMANWKRHKMNQLSETITN